MTNKPSSTKNVFFIWLKTLKNYTGGGAWHSVPLAKLLKNDALPPEKH